MTQNVLPHTTLYGERLEWNSQQTQEERTQTTKDLRDGSRPFRGGHGNTMLSLAGVGGQQRTVS